VQRQSLEEGCYFGVSKNWCHCPCAPWNIDHKYPQTSKTGVFFTVFLQKTLVANPGDYTTEWLRRHAANGMVNFITTCSTVCGTSITVFKMFENCNANDFNSTSWVHTKRHTVKNCFTDTNCRRQHSRTTAYSYLESLKSYKPLKLTILKKIAKDAVYLALQRRPWGNRPDRYNSGKLPSRWN